VVNSEAGGRHAHHRTNAFHISAVLKLTAEMHLASFFFFFLFTPLKYDFCDCSMQITFLFFFFFFFFLLSLSQLPSAKTPLPTVKQCSMPATRKTISEWISALEFLYYAPFISG